MQHLLALVLVLGSPDAGGPRVILGSGTAMCAALTAADLTAVGLKPDPQPRGANSTEKVSAYCTYTTAFASAGGIELDVFDGEGDPLGTQATALGDLGHAEPADLPGVDASLINLHSGSAGHPSAFLLVRHRRLVTVLTVPAGPRAREQLVSLTKVVLTRVSH
jgi:hypothetical protein